MNINFKYITIAFCFIISISQISGKDAIIGGIKYKNIDIGPDFVEETKEKQNWEPPAATESEEKAGLMVFKTSDPGDYLTWRIPKKSEHISSLSLGITPGETTAQWFGIWSLNDLNNIDIKVISPSGIKLEVRRIHCWPQRSRNYKSRTFHIVPELLLKQQGGKTQYPFQGGILKWKDFDLKKGVSCGLWLNVQAAPNLKSGIYNAKIILNSKRNQQVVVQVKIQVYPFTLPKQLANKRWILYCWPNRYRSGANPELDFKNMVEHGIDGFLDNAYLMVNISKNKNGSLNIKDRNHSIRWVEKIICKAQKAGMRGPFGLWTTPVNRSLAKIYGININETWPPEMYQGVKKLKQYFDKEYGKLGIKDWMSFASDEPKPGNKYAVQALKAWKAAGAKTYCTAYFGTYINMAKHLTDPCIGYGNKQSRDLIKKDNARQWMIGDGCYIGKHEMGRHRRRVGINFYLSGTYGCAIWRWGGSHGDPFNDFDGVEYRAPEPADQLLAYPQMKEKNNWKSYLGPIPTIAWESIREGINDYKYLYVLQQTITQALNSKMPAAKQKATETATVLKKLQKVIFASSEVESRNSDVAKFSTNGLIKIRKWAAQETVTLKAYMQKKQLTSKHNLIPEIKVCVSPKVNVSQQKNILLPPPILTIAKTNSKPIIDGIVGKREWANSAIATIPGTAKTKARIMYDDANLYVCWVCIEPKMNRIIPVNKNNDIGPIWPQDSVEFFIAPSKADGKFAHIMINNLGRWISEGNGRFPWNAKALVTAKRYKDKYIIELALPWKSLAEIAPLPWKDVKLNFCRVRNPDSDIFNTNKFNWAYGTGSFHKPDKFGSAKLINHGLLIIKSSYSIKQDGTFWVNIDLFNNTSKNILARLEKIPGRKLRLSTKQITTKNSRRAIGSQKSGRLSRKINLERKSRSWVLINKLNTHANAVAIRFKVPGMIDINPLTLDQKHYVVNKERQVKVVPLICNDLKGYFQVNHSQNKGGIVPIKEANNISLIIHSNNIVNNVFLNHLDNNKKLISKTKITIVNLP